MSYVCWKISLSFICCRMANFEALDFKGSGINQSKKESGLSEYAGSLFDPALTWKDVDWLKSVTELPLIIKGILSGKALCWISKCFYFAHDHLDCNLLFANVTGAKYRQ